MFIRKLTRHVLLCFVTIPLWAQVQIDLSLLNPSAQVFETAAFNIEGLPDSKDYYQLQITDGDSPSRITMAVEFLRNGQLLWRRQTRPFNLSGDGGSWFVTGVQLETGLAFINQQLVEFGPLQSSIAEMDELKTAIRKTGRLPAGSYRMRAVFATETNGVPGDEVENDPSSNNTFQISNPTTVDLLFPGASVSTNEVVEVATLFPFFQWQTDVLPARGSYQITVYEKLADEETVADVFSKPPVLDISGHPDTFLQYPTGTDPALSGGVTNGPIRLLNRGKTYYWQVSSQVGTAVDALVIESDVFRFRISDAASASDVNYEKQILSILQQLLGTEYSRVVKELREQGYDPGRQIQLDGNSVGIEDLLELLSQIENGELRVISAEVY